MEASYDEYNMWALGMMNEVENNGFAAKDTRIIEDSIVTFVRFMDRLAM